MIQVDNKITFNKPYLTGRELSFIAEAHQLGQLSGDGTFTMRCQKWIEENCSTQKALITHSCTAALEMAAILCNIEPGDEVIMPSYTFVSTANAFAMRGAKPVFIDIRLDTLNIDESKIEAAITKKTKAIVPVHYAGVACEMDKIMEIAKKYNLFVIEDAAQACMSSYKGKKLGTIGDLGCYSFHETKNIISGEGGALLVNNGEMIERAEIIREKGTNRSRFLRGEIDKYTWTDIGSSYLPGEIIAAFLWAQMLEAESITNKRISIWNNYNELIKKHNHKFLKTPTVPHYCTHNAHMYYVIHQSAEERNNKIDKLKKVGIQAVSHYVPLHSSSFGKKFEGNENNLPNTDHVSNGITRLPLWIGLSEAQQETIIKIITE
jgi:dTDP-4-amino-4,6-dideoxygalactose transaminase